MKDKYKPTPRTLDELWPLLDQAETWKTPEHLWEALNGIVWYLWHKEHPQEGKAHVPEQRVRP